MSLDIPLRLLDPAELPVRRTMWASIWRRADWTLSGMPVTSKTGSFSRDGVTMYVWVCCWMCLMVAPLGPTTRPTKRQRWPRKSVKVLRTKTQWKLTNTIRNSNQYRYLSGNVGRRSGWRPFTRQTPQQWRLSRCPNQAEVLSGWQNFSFGLRDIFFTSSHNKDGLFTANWRLDVGVCLST